MDINAEACIKQGEELGMIAKKKSALKYQMQSFANNLICTNPKDSLEKLCQNCQKACQYFISGFTKGNSSSIRKKQAQRLLFNGREDLYIFFKFFIFDRNV